MFEALFPTSSSSLCPLSIITTKTDIVIAYYSDFLLLCATDLCR